MLSTILKFADIVTMFYTVQSLIIFFDRVSSLSFSRIDDINEDIGLNGWGLKTDIQEYTSSVELLQPVDLFYQFNGRFLPEKELVHVLDR